MKKWLCMLLAVAMLVSLCGCVGGDDGEDVRGDIIQGGETGTTTTVPSEEEEFSLGSATGSVYKSDFLGLTFTAPEGWVFSTDEEIRELNQITEEYYGEELAEQLKEANIVYDMNASDPTNGSSANINLEKFSALQIATMDIKATMEAQKSALISTYENMGFTNTVVEYKKVTVDGKSFDGMQLTSEISGVAFYATIFSFKKGNYLATVTVGCLQTDTIADLLDCFTVE